MIWQTILGFYVKKIYFKYKMLAAPQNCFNFLYECDSSAVSSEFWKRMKC